MRVEWVEPACAAAWNAVNEHPNRQWDADHIDLAGPSPIEKGRLRKQMRAALAAVAPLIAAEALERAAVVAEGIPYHGRYRTWPWWANPDGSQGNRENESDVVRHADKIASAIRAMKETT